MYKIGEVSLLSGVNIETIRYYERTGVVAGPQRSQSGWRTYSDHEVSTLRFVKRCRDLGFSIPDIRNLLEFAEETEQACGNVLDVAQSHIREIRQKIADLRQLEAALRELSSNCKSGSTDCAMLAALFRDDAA